MADFQNGFISQILAVYSSRFFFAQKSPNVVVESFLHVFANLSFLPKLAILQRLYIAFARWPIFKIILFLEYLLFF